VIVNVKDRNLISAWKKSWKTVIPDYKIDDTKNVKTTVTKREFISECPEMLIFQVNRVEYTERFEMVKVNDSFDFEKELFIDQFLEKNSDQILANERENEQIENELEILYANLDKLDNFYGEQRSLLGRI
jgi:uncharacterized UBP type Zn finger protein